MTSLETPAGVVNAVDELCETVAAAIVSTDASPGGGPHLTKPAIGSSAVWLAALRSLGPDALAPFVLTAQTITDHDVDALRAARAAFPEPIGGVSPGVWAMRDWATDRILHRLGHHTGEREPEPSGWDPPSAWPAFTVGLLPLCSLALPGLDGAVRRAARHRRGDLARGVARSIMRRDLRSAARLTRWLALDPPTAGAVEDHRDAALAHIAVLGGQQPQVNLQVAVATALLARNGPR